MQADEPRDDTIHRLLALGAATIGESGGRPTAPRLKPAWSGARVAGPAHTAACPAGDNLAIHVAVAQAAPGSVLVVEIGPGDPYGYWGEVLTTGAQARGLLGLVIDGGVRDVDAVAARGFPVFAATVALRGAQKVGPGTMGHPVVVGEVEVCQGDWIVGDTDGVAVIAAADLDTVLAAGQARADKEQGLFRALEAGQTTVDLFGLDPSAIDTS
ncbi:MAG: 4-hydroxy-4-methyl-2-oxoglutarate aldolase [Acidimicrobiaceae bacterium]